MDRKTQAVVEQYAVSLAEIALEHDQVAEIQADLDAILTVCQETELSSVLTSLAVARSDKETLVQALQAQASPFVKNFLAMILFNERENLLVPIVQAVLEQVQQATREYAVTVTTAVSLSDQQKDRLMALGSMKFAIQAKSLEEKIDPAIIGGFVLEANNQIIDTSIKSQLQQLKNNLK